MNEYLNFYYLFYCFLGGTNAIHLRAIRQREVDSELYKGDYLYELSKENFFNINNFGGRLVKFSAQLAPILIFTIPVILLFNYSFPYLLALLLFGWLFFYSFLPIWLNNTVFNTKFISLVSLFGIILEPFLIYNVAKLILVKSS
jgi:hypothetical protein